MEQQQIELFAIIGKITYDLDRSQKDNQRLDTELKCITNKYEKLKEKTAKKRDNRTLDCFENNAKIRHKYKEDCRECHVDKSDPTHILRVNTDETYTSLSMFASKHIEVLRSQGIAHGNTPPTANGWTDCEVEIDGEWVSCDDISKKYNQSL